MKTRNPVIHWTNSEEVQVANAMLGYVSHYQMIKMGNEILSIIMKAQQVLPSDRRRAVIYNNKSIQVVVDLAKELWPEYAQRKVKEIQENDGLTLKESEKSMYPSSVKDKTMEDICREIVKEEISKSFNIEVFASMLMDAVTHPTYGNVVRDILRDVIKDDCISTATVVVKVPTIAVLGPNPDQQNELEAEFKGRCKFVFYQCEKSKMISFSKKKLQGCDWGFAMTKFISHPAFYQFRDYMNGRYTSNAGGVSTLKVLISQALIELKSEV